LETDFPKNAILKLGGWLQTAYFDQENDIFMLMKHVQKYEMTNVDLKRRCFLLTVDRSSGGSPMSNNTVCDA